MPYQGPKLDPVPETDSIWGWFFDRVGSSGELNISRNRNGFRDAVTGKHTTFQDVKTQAIHCASALSSLHGLQPQQTVAVLAQNSVNYAVATFAAGRLGAVVTALPSLALSQDIAHYLEASSARIVFYDKYTEKEVFKAWKGPGMPPYTLIPLDAPSGTGKLSLQKLVTDGAALPIQTSAWSIPRDQSNKKVCAFLAFSSGTTGKPKAIMISHANMIAQCMQMRALIPGQPGTLLSLLPFYHITGLVHLLHLPILLDQEAVIMGEFTLATMLDTVIKYRCVELWLVPPLLIRMVSDEVRGKYDVSFVRQFNTGAAPLAPQIIEQLSVAYPGVAMRQAWGMTESCSCLTVTPPDLATYEHAAKVGKPVAGTELKAISVKTGKEVNLGEEGELWARGPQITMGYLNNEEETRKSYDADGFLHTGDLGTIQPDGFVTIHDRIKEMIKVRGHGVAPAELEDTLHSHPKVADVAVIGVPHDYSGEVPRAYVVLKPIASASRETAQELKAHVEKLKARYMRLTGGVEFVDAIPKSAAGKILRKVLMENYNKVLQRDTAAKL
ncbi:hypothetical protein SEUCBS140593_006048 [Sporothrix eucalyptigena]|uniref:Uncharacterized protein n=1 Tax=Sporothrix eucalyptigena TaxID=1812306 RepID=A0ABP0C1J6_9PEZI